jgi:hypothetical protein
MRGFVTVKATELLFVPPTLTTTFTLPATNPDGTLAVMEFPPLLQFVTDAVTPPNVTLLVSWLEPKPLPLITTEVADAPELGFRLVIEGAAKREALAHNKTETQASMLRAERSRDRM